MRRGNPGRMGALAAALTGAAALLWSAAAFAQATPPGLGTGCGSGASIVGSDTAGKVTLGTGSGICVLTFAGTYTNAPACTAVDETNAGANAAPAGVKTTPTQLTIVTPWNDGDTIAYICGTY